MADFDLDELDAIAASTEETDAIAASVEDPNAARAKAVKSRGFGEWLGDAARVAGRQYVMPALEAVGSTAGGLAESATMGVMSPENISYLPGLGGVGEEAQALREEYPAAATVGEFAGYLVSPAAKVGTATSAAMKGAGALARGVAGGSMGAMAQVAGESLVDQATGEDVDPDEVAKDLTLAGGVGGIAGGALSKLGAAAQKFIADPNSALGQRIRDLAKVGRKGRKALPAREGDPGIKDLASQQGREVTTKNLERLGKVRKTYESEMAAALRESGKEVPVQPIMAQLDDMDSVLNFRGRPVGHEEAARAVTNLRAGIADGDMFMSPEEVIQLKKVIGAKAYPSPGQVVTGDTAPWRKLYGLINESIETVAPKAREVSAKYGQTMRKLEGINDRVFGKNRADIPDTATARRRAQNTMAKIGKRVGGEDDEKLAEELISLDPELFGPMIDQIRAKVAQESLRFGYKASKEGELLRRNIDALLAKFFPLAQGMESQAGRIAVPVDEARAKVIKMNRGESR